MREGGRLADFAGYTEGSREKSPRATRGYRMTRHTTLAATRQDDDDDDDDDQDEASRSTQDRQEKGVAWLLVDLGFRLEDPRIAQHRSRRLTTYQHAALESHRSFHIAARYPKKGSMS
jgi:hypothetical protein